MRKQYGIKRLDDGAEGAYRILITTGSVDREGDRVLPDGVVLDNYKRNPVVMWLHDYTGRTASQGIPIGRTHTLELAEDGQGIVAEFEFLQGDEFAERVKNAWDQGFLRTASIGFRPIRSVENEFGGRDFQQWELLEWSLVPIPMNQDAVRLAFKTLGFDELLEAPPWWDGLPEDELKQYFVDDTVEKFAGSPRNPYGTHSSYQFKGGLDGYKAAWRCHFSKIGGGSLNPSAAGPIRGTVRRTEMIAAAMKPPCRLPSTDSIGPRSGPPSPLKCTYPEKPSDYGLSEWKKPETDADREGVKLSCRDLSIIKTAALAEIKRRAADREREQGKAEDSVETETIEQGSLPDIEQLNTADQERLLALLRETIELMYHLFSQEDKKEHGHQDV